MYVVDTNLYVRAFTSSAFASDFAVFVEAAVGELSVSVVVLFELLAGAQDAHRAAGYERALLAPFRSRGRLLVPTDSTWRLAADVVRALRARKDLAGSLAQRSFLNDILIAASCREAGATLVTANARDFAIIRQVLGFLYVTELPAV